jgi:putative acetyltransferase
MRNGVIVRPARGDDRDAIVALVRAAFTSGGHDGQQEVDIVEATWSINTPDDGFELVAQREGLVVGHVLAALGSLDRRPVLGIAPLSVAPDYQRAGIGTALVDELLQRIDAASHPVAVLLGSPSYYERFGFEPAGPLGVTYLPAGAGNPSFMIRRFASYDPSFRGLFVYCWEAQPE